MENKEVPVFIKLEEYNDVVSIVTVIKKKLAETNETLMRIKQLKAEEEQEISGWEKNIQDIQEKIGFIDKLLKEPRF